MSDKELAEEQYEKYLSDIEKTMRNKLTTFLSELDHTGRVLFGHKYKGTYPRDLIPPLTDLQPYCIANLDRSDQPGSHWIALAKIQNKNEYLFYDSFARHHSKIMADVEKLIGARIRNTEDDVEQDVLEQNCGQRSMAFLCVFDKHGANIAEYI